MSDGIGIASGRSCRILLVSAAACAAGLLLGCQSYERMPLDLESHGREYEIRLAGADRIVEFLARVDELGTTVPEYFDIEDGVSLAEAEAIALVYNPDLRMARLRAGVARADFDYAGLWQDPVFGFDGADILSNASPFEYGLQLSLTIPISGRLAVEKDRAGAAYEAELRRIMDAEWSVRSAVRRAWSEWTIAGEQREVLNETVRRLERIAELATDLESAGELIRIDVRLMRLELLHRRAACTDSEYRFRTARQELLTLLGLPPHSEIDFIPGLPTESNGCTEDITPPYDRLIAANTLLAIRRAEYQVAEESLRLAIREQYPDLSIGGGYGSEGDDRLLLGLSIPVPILNANRGGIARARAERELARAGAETAFEQITSEWIAQAIAFLSARQQRLLHETDLLPLLAEQLDDLDRLASLGEWNAVLLIDAIAREADAKSQLLALHLAEATAAINLMHLLGPDSSPEMRDDQ